MKTKRITYITILMLLSLNVISQEYVVTEYGLKNKQDITKNYLVFDEMEGLSAQQLYDNAFKYINENYKNPNEVIKGNITGQYLKFITYDPDFIQYDNSGVDIAIGAKYTTELKFKDI